jgi:hypothetical protein
LQLTGGKGGVGNGLLAAYMGIKLPETNRAIANKSRVTLFRIFFSFRVGSRFERATTVIFLSGPDLQNLFATYGRQRRGTGVERVLRDLALHSLSPN